MNNMRYIIALWLMIAICLTTCGSPAWAETYNQDQLGLLAKECLSMGKAIGMMEAGKGLVESTNSDYGQENYNSMVPQINEMIKKHNTFILYVFSDNSTLLSKLLIEPYSYL